MRDKQYFTVEDLDSAHRAGVAYGLTNGDKGSNRVERALELIRNKQGGTKVADSKSKDASKLLLGLGLSGAAIAAATGGSRKANEGNESKESTESNSSSNNKGKAGTDLPLGLTIGKDGTASPALDGKVASILDMVGKLATKVNPAIGIGITLLTSLLTKDLDTKAKDFNKSEEEKFQAMLSTTDKDYSKVTGLMGISNILNTDATSTIMNTPEPSGDSTDSTDSTAGYTGSTY